MPVEFQPIFRLKGHRDSLYSLCEDLDDEHFLSAGGDGLVARWSIYGETDARLVAQLPATVYSMLIYDQQLLVGTREGDIHLIDLVENREIKRFKWNKEPVFALQPIADGWLSAHGDGRLLRWQMQNKEAAVIAQHGQPQAPLRALAVSNDLIAAGYSDHHIRLFDQNLQEVARLEGHTNSVFSLLFLKNGKYLLSGSRDAMLNVWETASGKLLDRFPAHTATINHLLHLPELGLIASAGRDKSVKLWDDTDLSLKKVVDYEKFPGLAHSHSVNRLFWNNKEQSLWSVGDDRLIVRYNIEQ